MQYIDKVRETAKNYLQPFLSINLPTIKNIEFSDIVECSPIFVELVGHLDWTSKFENWKKNNNFLYSPNLWNNFFLKRFHEAEYEQFTSRSYVYQ